MRKSLMCVGVALFPAVSAYAEDPVAALRELYPHAKVMHVGAQRAVMITPTANAPGGGGGEQLSATNRLTYIFGR